MYVNGRPITGPFIFLDELEYFSYARDVFQHADLSRHTQFGPLYPGIASVFFFLGDVGRVYEALRIFNVVVFVSSAVPAFLLARDLFPGDRHMWLWFPALVVTAPFSGFVYLVWAEPLYFTLFVWTVWCLFRLYLDPGPALGCLSGTLLALLFHGKPGAGLIIAIAAYGSMLWFFLAARRAGKHRLLLPLWLSLTFWLLLTLPWIIRNVALGVGIIGYSGGSADLASRVRELGGFQIATEIGSSVFYQLSYVFIGTWGLIAVLIVMPVARWQRWGTEIRAIALFVILCVIGLVVLSAVGVTAYRGLGYWYPNGRYHAVLFAVAMLMGIRFLISHPAPGPHERRLLYVTAGSLGIAAVLATPLHAMHPPSFVNNAELALVTLLIDRGRIVWRGMYEPSLSQTIAFAAAFAVSSMIFTFTSKRPAAMRLLVWLLLLANMAVSAAEQQFVTRIGFSQAGLNDAVRFLRREVPDISHRVMFDEQLANGNTEWMLTFWTGMTDKLRYVNVADIAGPAAVQSSAEFLISRQTLPLPVAYSSPGIFAYRLSGARPGN